MGVLDKVALVTGAADGIGKAIASRLLEKGAKGVGLLDIKAAKGQETARLLSSTFGEKRVLYAQCDVSSNGEIEGAFQKVKSHFGSLDIVCNNAAIVDEIYWERSIDINLKAVIRGTYLGLEHMGTKNGGKGGVVINIASTNGLLPNPLVPVYAATKHGIVGFSRSTAMELMMTENNIRVNAVCPGLVRTQMVIDIGESGSRYKELYSERVKTVRNVPKATISDTVLRIIEDTSYNGVSCAVIPDDPMLLVDPPNFSIK
ncbi:15-hydroxyprostaglandin dehydrogenase [NAD(+)]-like isoform X1 [Glandiceps talaboti]